MSNIFTKMMKPPTEPGDINARERPLTVLTATFFYTGYLPKAPGTWGALATVIAAYFLFPQNLWLQVIITAAVFLIGVPASKRAEEIYGKDGGPIVIDETAGMLTTLIAVPKTIPFYVIAFFAFRFFDIVKPYPGRKSEGVSNGWGVMLDDIIAGLYGLIVMHIIILIYTNFYAG
ncbi:MAG: phosphatidylglycerophosphatase A [candidate division Zixibacteria bacterium]|nr:phosphatidylglycerophosphatase A [candidate division Zixibacteria bacterium]